MTAMTITQLEEQAYQNYFNRIPEYRNGCENARWSEWTNDAERNPAFTRLFTETWIAQNGYEHVTYINPAASEAVIPWGEFTRKDLSTLKAELQYIQKLQNEVTYWGVFNPPKHISNLWRFLQDRYDVIKAAYDILFAEVDALYDRLLEQAEYTVRDNSVPSGFRCTVSGRMVTSQMALVIW